jgi:spore coat protein YutH
MQRGTICFRRFPYEQNVESILTPDGWVYDHPARDISEWIRALYWQEAGTADVYRKMTTFLNDYERIKPLTISCWRLIYGRLLFPLHYFEAIEGYYMSKNEHEKNKHKEQLVTIIGQTTNYERFLKDFYKSLGLPVGKLAIPQPEWLQRTV